MSIERDSSCCAIASRSASSTTTNSPFATSQPLTISSGPTSRSWVGHQRFCRIGVLHSRWRVRKLTSDCFAFGVVASARPTGMLTRPKLMDPFQMVLIAVRCQTLVWLRRLLQLSKSRGTRLIRPAAPHPCLTTIGGEVLTEKTPGQVAAPRTIARLWQDAVARRSEEPAYLVEDGGAWREVSWDKAAQTVEELA